MGRGCGEGSCTTGEVGRNGCRLSWCPTVSLVRACNETQCMTFRYPVSGRGSFEAGRCFQTSQVAFTPEAAPARPRVAPSPGTSSSFRAGPAGASRRHPAEHSLVECSWRHPAQAGGWFRLRRRHRARSFIRPFSNAVEIVCAPAGQSPAVPGGARESRNL